jgi:hypothetical protein
MTTGKLHDIKTVFREIHARNRKKAPRMIPVNGRYGKSERIFNLSEPIQLLQSENRDFMDRH